MTGVALHLVAVGVGEHCLSEAERRQCAELGTPALRRAARVAAKQAAVALLEPHARSDGARSDDVRSDGARSDGVPFDGVPFDGGSSSDGVSSAALSRQLEVVRGPGGAPQLSSRSDLGQPLPSVSMSHCAGWGAALAWLP